jgi:TctA family transporter
MEENLRRALLVSRGDPTIFVSRPISAAFLGCAVLIIIALLAPALRRRKEEAIEQSE